MDVYKYMNKEFDELAKKGCPKLLADASMFQIILSDQIYFDSEFAYFSLVPLEGYRSFSQLFDGPFKGYKLSEKTTIERATAPLLNYEHLRSILLEKNFESDEV
mmetsp:Transcript_11735/g.8558  ORF Transcript_11735/g.8558 Transcript_11735/m.8558 type:complete len:104 (-) Transcript_11735:218-529(-)|eukprot:CAMPEP_0202961096 /NCGR_PEP_ID=MMETSP1396-20130829/5179_1 /ASSEMBLY_ACC=CAM_ASM_000872 /TAXON_ID= /ORGANISM="Pseudokeronopsis sp., Strain Brazil" /LENGTH=103 /DNA_ID=CAMNT_0049680697 /DNA_START=118 /DNA_END=429 /DNA_ORIENTATION=+